MFTNEEGQSLLGRYIHALEHASERESVKRICDEMRDVFLSSPAPRNELEAMVQERAQSAPLPAPESGVEFERHDLNNSDDWESKP